MSDVDLVERLRRCQRALEALSDVEAKAGDSMESDWAYQLAAQLDSYAAHLERRLEREGRA